MYPIIAIVGRPNVGKSTLFNILTKKRDALVHDMPGVTRDRIYGMADIDGTLCSVIDTGGIERNQKHGTDSLWHLLYGQAEKAATEADCIVWVVDGQVSPLPQDHEVAKWLRTLNKPVLMVLNKTESHKSTAFSGEYHRFGFPECIAISALHNRGLGLLAEKILEHLPKVAETELPPDSGITVAVVGRPNVGKSTLINRIFGDERVVAFDEPGTTRDSIYIPFQRFGKKYTLVDTAGVRRKASVTDALEKFSVAKTLQAIEQAQVVIVVLNAREAVLSQDLSVMRLVLEAGKALIIALNKWDGMEEDAREALKLELKRRAKFAQFAPVFTISALHGTGVGLLFDPIDALHATAGKDLATPLLNNVLRQAVTRHAPPMVLGRRIKLRYAHCGGHHPQRVVIHGNQTEFLPDSYKRYLEHTFREALKLEGVPIVITLRNGKNPYEGKKSGW